MANETNIFSYIRKDVINLKKTIKRLLAVSLAAVIIISCFVISVFAGDKTTVEYKSDSTWTAVIPDTIKAQDASEDVNSAAYTVKTQNVVLGDGESLVGTIEYSGNLTDGNVNLPYSIYNSEGSVVNSGSRIIKQIAGEPTAEASFSFGAKLNEKAKYSGNYLGTATFNFSVAEVSYTLDEINADEHLYAIGKTKPEYVVAKFNDDYTSVKITRNGADSDGLMKDFQTIDLTQPYEAQTEYKNYDEFLAAFFDSEGVISIDNFDVNSLFPGDLSPMAEHAATLNTATISDGVKNIGAGAFIPGNLKDLDVGKELGQIAGAFGMSGIQSIEIANTVEEIGDWAFFYNTALGMTKTNDGYILTPISLPDSVQKIGKAAFYGLIRGTEYPTMRNINLGNGLIEIGKLNFTSKQSPWLISSEKSIPIKKWDSQNALTEVGSGHAFVFPASLKKTMDYSFKNTTFCGGRVTITGHIMKYAFESTKYEMLPYIADRYAPDTFFSNDRNGGYGLYNLSMDTISASNTDVADGMLNTEGNTIIKSLNNSLTKTTIPNYIKTIGEDAFFGQSKLTSVTIPDSVTTIERRAFMNTSALKNIEIPNSITSIGEDAFTDSGLINLTIPGSLIDIGIKAFSSCGALQSVNISEGVKNIGACAFSNCSGLTTVIIPNSVTAIADDGFENSGSYSLKGATTFYVKSGSFAETWAKKAQVNYNTDFTLDNNGGVLNGAQTALLTYVGNKEKYEVPVSVNAVDDMAFAFHSELKSVIIPQSVTSIGTYTFAMCQSLTDIVLPEGITSIGEGAFYNCTSLKRVTIPSSVTSIGNGAFTDDNGNLSITVYGTAGSYAETWAKNNGYTFIAQ